MSRLNYLSEREWVVYTIEEELDNLERLAPPRDAFSTEELNALRQSAVRLNRFVSKLDSGADEEPLPHWLQRKPSHTPADEDDDDDGKSAASA